MKILATRGTRGGLCKHTSHRARCARAFLGSQKHHIGNKQIPSNRRAVSLQPHSGTTAQGHRGHFKLLLPLQSPRKHPDLAPAPKTSLCRANTASRCPKSLPSATGKVLRVWETSNIFPLALTMAAAVAERQEGNFHSMRSALRTGEPQHPSFPK